MALYETYNSTIFFNVHKNTIKGFEYKIIFKFTNAKHEKNKKLLVRVKIVCALSNVLLWGILGGRRWKCPAGKVENSWILSCLGFWKIEQYICSETMDFSITRNADSSRFFHTPVFDLFFQRLMNDFRRNSMSGQFSENFPNIDCNVFAKGENCRWTNKTMRMFWNRHFFLFCEHRRLGSRLTFRPSIFFRETFPVQKVLCTNKNELESDWDYKEKFSIEFIFKLFD